jgi:tetratricopeptide (TPR) repeat protein
VVETLRAGLPVSQEKAEREKVHLPPRMQAVLQTRLAQLSPSARDLAGLAATIGRSFSVTVLARAVEADADTLVQGLDELWQRRIVRERGADGYDFTHDKLREAAYNMLSPARRRLLHRRVAQALDSIPVSDRDAVARRVAVHYDLAGQHEHAIPRYLQAGQAAAKIYAHQEAVASFQRGLALLEEGGWDASLQAWRHEMAADLYEGLGDAQQLSHPDEARQAYHKALDETAPDEWLRQACLLRSIARTLNTEGQFQTALEFCDQASARLGAEPLEPADAWWREWLALQYGRFHMLYALARWREIELTFVQVESITEQHGAAVDRALYYASRVITALRRDRYVISDATLADARKGLVITQKMGDLSWIAQAHFIVGWILVLRGVFDEAEEPLRASLAFSEQIGYPLYQAWALTWLTVLFRSRGQVDRARHYAARALEVASTGGIPEQEAMAQANLAWLAWREGDHDQVEELARAAFASWRRGQWIYAFHWTARLPLLALSLDRNQVPDALEQAQALLDPQQQKLPDPLEAALLAAVQAGEAQQAAEAAAHLRRAVQVAQETGFL